jgi:3-oxoacyl-[acyl-carrier protein] reductase
MQKRTAVVTGGSTGIGASICQHLLEADYKVINLSRREASFEHDELINYPVDLSDRVATAEVGKIIANDNDITVFIHNAGLIRPDLLEDVKIEDLDYLTNVHLGADIILTQAFLPAMKAAGFGRIINITSRASLGLQTRTAYSATKSGMIGMTRTWALELAPSGITVNAIAPGPIAATEMFHDVIPDGSDRMKQLAENIPVQRLGHPDDVARAVIFFVAPGSSFITGQTLFVCGGSSIASLSI